MLLGIEKAVCLVKEKRGFPPAIPVPVRCLPQLMLDLPDRCRRRFPGSFRPHPHAGRPAHRERGHDKQSGLYLAFAGRHSPAEPTAHQGRCGRGGEADPKDLFAEVQFRDPATGRRGAPGPLPCRVARKVLPQAPAGLITAAVQGTGKTTAAENAARGAPRGRHAGAVHLPRQERIPEGDLPPR